jgi:hypothetical protein
MTPSPSDQFALRYRLGAERLMDPNLVMIAVILLLIIKILDRL